MAELHIDDDWKRQAQEEKRRLAEEAEKRRQQSSQANVGGIESAAAAGAVAGAVPPTATAGGAAAAGARGGRGARGTRELPEASFGTLVQSFMTQALFYLGELATAGGEGGVNLDMAKHQLDSLGVLEDKTKGNLSADEQKLLDAALYETRMRFVSVASQYVNPY